MEIRIVPKDLIDRLVDLSLENPSLQSFQVELMEVQEAQPPMIKENFAILNLIELKDRISSRLNVSYTKSYAIVNDLLEVPNSPFQ